MQPPSVVATASSAANDSKTERVDRLAGADGDKRLRENILFPPLLRGQQPEAGKRFRLWPGASGMMKLACHGGDKATHQRHSDGSTSGRWCRVVLTLTWGDFLAT
jgi:hypothetical protein